MLQQLQHMRTELGREASVAKGPTVCHDLAARAAWILQRSGLHSETEGRCHVKAPRAIRSTVLLPAVLVAVAVGMSVAEAAGSGPDGVVLVDEVVVLVDAGGASMTTVRRVLRPATERGAERVAKIVFPFRSWTEKVRLRSARRTTCDGREVPVPAEATFVETPQPLAEQHFYTDIAQLVLLFPGVRPGDTIEYTIEKETAATVPGHFSAFLTVADLWPVAEARREIVVPAGWGSRLKHRCLGLGKLSPRGGQGADGRQRLCWQVSDVPALGLEKGRQPIRQGGPGIWVSTLPSWSAMARWYGGLINSCGELGPVLERLVAEWTDSLSDPVEVVSTLHRRVSEHVSFLGLEFGLSALCPRPPAEVWSSGFGDCKDTANLLRAMLARAGVPARLVLVNTQHAGLIEADVPTYQQFNHIVLAATRPDGSLLFCDPSASELPAGVLPPSVGGRQGLLVEESGGRLIDLPLVAAGNLQLDFDLTLLPPDHLQGWLHIEADAYQGSLALTHLLGTSYEGRSTRVSRFVAGFFPDSEVLGARAGDAVPGGQVRKVDIFFRAAVAMTGEGAALEVPTTAVLLPRFGTEERRQTPYFQPLGSTTVAVTYRLPSGWALTKELPKPLEVDTGCRRIEARWASSPEGLSARLRHETTRSLIEPAAWVSCVRTLMSLRAWLSSRAVVAPVLDPGRGAPAGSLVNLPRLPTGRAQLDLVNAMFPRGEGPDRRRAAMQMVEKWFANDPETVLEAGLERAILDQEAGRAADSVEAIHGLLDRHRAVVGPELRGWAEYLLATGLRECGKADEALDIYDRLARHADLSAARRGWAYARAAHLRLETSPLEALAILDEALGLESPALEQQVALLGRLYMAEVPGADLDARLDRIGERYPERALDIHGRLLREVRAQLDDGRFAGAGRLIGVLERRVGPGSAVRLLEPEVRRTRDLVDQGMRCQEVAQAMSRYLAATPPRWWDRVTLPADNRDRLVSALQQLDRDQGSLEFVRGSLELLTRWSVTPDFFAFLLRRSADHLGSRGGDDGLLSRLEQWSARLQNPDPCEKEVAR